jgi:hypothetical protein
MDETEYLKMRVDNQINWYDKKSQNNQKLYKWLRIVEILAAASIPFLVGYITNTELFFRAFVGLLGFAIAVITAVVSLCQFQENWVEYRTTCESLKHEKFLYLTRTEPYNIDTPFSLFVQRVESMISRENTMWSQYIRPDKKEAKHG